MRKESKQDRRWRKQWREQCRRQLQRDVKSRMLFGFARVYKPVMDDAPYRIFESMAAYRAWCEQHLPKYLGDFRPPKSLRQYAR